MEELIVRICFFAIVFSIIGYFIYVNYFKDKKQKPEEKQNNEEKPIENDPIDEPKDEPKDDPIIIDDSSDEDQIDDSSDDSSDETFDDGSSEDSSDEEIDEPEEDPIDQEPQLPSYDLMAKARLDMILEKYKSIVDINEGSHIYNYLKILVEESLAQYDHLSIDSQLPLIYEKDNFPVVYDYFGDEIDYEGAKDALCGWIVSLQLAELIPTKKTEIFKIGYNIAGDKTTAIYNKYDFESDRNVARIVAGAIYVAMRGKRKPDIDTMRKEVSGSKFDDKIEKLNESKRDNVCDSCFFTDFREFLPTAPGPYAPGYKTRPDKTYPNDEKDEYKNLKVDRDIHEYIVKNYNLDNKEHFQETVQAIADKEAAPGHLFGPNIETKHYHFHPVFGEDTIGTEISTNGEIARFVYIAITSSSASRGIMQSANVTPKQYGRMRPGCSWTQEGTKNSSSDNRRNILTNFEIEDGDGSPTGYYDKKGKWVYKNAINNPSDFEESQRNLLYANSYPSGHSSGITGGGMVLIELMPERADKILKCINQYAINRTIARYHWTSDTINGRVLGTATNAVAHAAKDYDDLLELSRKELS